MRLRLLRPTPYARWAGAASWRPCEPCGASA